MQLAIGNLSVTGIILCKQMVMKKHIKLYVFKYHLGFQVSLQAVW
jgi:hypothetical protein